MKREAVLFYKSFDEAISMLSDEDQLKAYKAIVKYGLYGDLPELDGVSGAIFMLAKPQIDANNRRYENGKQGGRPKKINEETAGNQDETKKKPRKNLTETEGKPKEKEKEKEKEKDKELTRAQIESIFENLWMKYPEKKGKGRVSDADKRKIANIGEEHMIRAISRYMNEIKQIGWKQYQNGSTFFHSGYVDYLDENYVRSKQGKPPNEWFNNEISRDYDMKDLELKLLGSNKGG